MALHLGMRAAQPDLVFEDIDGNEAALKDLIASVHKTKTMDCNIVTLAFSRRALMWELNHVGAHGREEAKAPWMLGSHGQ